MVLRPAGASTNLPGQQAACVASRRGSSRPVSSTPLRCSSADVGDLQEQAAKAKADAEEAERRLASLKAASASAKKAAPPPVAKKVVVEEPVELMDEEQLAKEMSELLGGLQKRGGGGKTDPLTGSKWALDLDFGREKGTWMDAKWGASGRRVKRGLAVEFASGGKVKGVESYTFGLKQTLKGVKGGEWKVEGAFPGEKVKFFVDHDGFTAEESGCDIDLPPGEVPFFTAPKHPLLPPSARHRVAALSLSLFPILAFVVCALQLESRAVDISVVCREALLERQHYGG